MQHLARAARVLALIAAVLTCMATSAPRYRFVRSYPTWNLERPPTPGVGCATRVSVWVSKTGKTGIGVSVLLASDSPCDVGLEALSVSAGELALTAPALPPTAIADRGRSIHFYTPIPFDNLAAWNAGDRSGVLRVRLRAGDQTVEWALAAAHIRRANHDRIPFHQPQRTVEPETGIVTVTPQTSPRGPIEVVP